MRVVFADDALCGLFLQVIRSFIAFGGLAVVTTGFCLIIERYEVGSKAAYNYNPVYRWVRLNVHRHMRRRCKQLNWIHVRPEKIKSCSIALVLSLSDTHIASGVALLCAGVTKLHRDEDLIGSISTYHFPS